MQNNPLVVPKESVEGEANGPPTEKSLGGKFRILGAESLKGATPNPRRYDWKTYHDMYEKHATVNAAIRKVVKVAVNTGYEFVPRTVSDEMIEEEVKIARDFFNNSRGFKDELTYTYLALMIYGESYMYVVPKRNRQPKRLKYIPPWTMNIKADKHGEVIEYFQIDPESPNSAPIRYSPKEIIHFKIHNPKDKLYGLSPLEPLKSVVLTDILAENFNRQFFKNGATTGTVFVLNGASDETVKRMQRYIHEKYVGSENAHLPLVMEGDISVHNASPSIHDMGFEEGRASIRAQILAVLDVPPAKLGYMETANRSNSREQDKTFRTESILPLQNIVETALSDQLLMEILGIKTVMFNHSDADVRDRQEQMELWARAVQNGIMTVNEVRNMQGLEMLDGGDIAFVMAPTGAVPLTDLELYFRLAQPNTDKIPEELHAGHGHSEGPTGLRNEAPKRREDDPDRKIGQAPATKSIEHEMIASLIEKSKSDEVVLRHVWAYAHDLPENDTNDLIIKSLTKAVKTDDDLLRLTYIERAQGIVSQVMKGVGSG